MELDHISRNTDSMETLILKINQLLDTISIAFNDLEDEKINTAISSVIKTEVQSVLKRVIGKNFKMGTTNGASVSDNTLYVDKADSKLKFKDKSSTVTSLT